MSFFSPIPFPGVRRPTTAISFFGSATNLESATITLPAGIIAGDLIVLADIAHGNPGAVPAITPTGFTNASNLVGAGNDERQMLSYKLATGSEGGATITGMIGAFGAEKAALVFRGNFPAITLTPSVPTAQVTSGDPTPQVVAASGVIAPLVVIGAYGGSSPTVFPSMIPTADGQITPDAFQLYLAYKIYNSNPANLTIDQNNSPVESFLQGMYIRMN